MKGLDLRKFKKLHSSKDTTTMVHPDGHKITIAHSKLKPEHAKQLADLPKFDNGGMVAESDVRYNHEDPNLQQGKGRKPWETEASANLGIEKKSKYDQEMARFTGNVKMLPKYADGGDVPEDSPDLNVQPHETLPGLDTQPNLLPEEKLFSQPMAAPVTGMKNPEDTYAPESAGGSGIPEAPEAQPSNPNLGFNAPTGSQQPPSMDQKNPLMAGVQQEQRAVDAVAKAQSDAAIAQADILKARQSSMDTLQAKYNQESADTQQEINAAVKDYKDGHIDPQHFWNSKTDTGKFASAIGVMLGSLGGALSGKGNVALDFVNKQIDRDIEAQRMEIGKKHGLVSMLYQKMGNMRDATTMAKAIQAETFSNQLSEAAERSKSPQAMANAQLAKAQIYNHIAPQIAETNLRQATFKGLQEHSVSPEHAVPILVPKEHQAKVFGEIQAAQNTQHMGKNIMEAFDAAAKETRPTEGGVMNVFPGYTAPHVRALHQHMQPTFQDLEGTVRQAAMDNTFDNITPRFGDSDKTIAIKRQALSQYLQSKMSAPTAKGYGIDIQSFYPAAQSGFNKRK